MEPDRTPSRISSARLPLPPGARVGRYLICELLGVGGSGCVYEVSGRGGRTFALKLFDPDLARKSMLQLRFRREFDVLRRLTHPNIVRCYELGWDAERETSYLVMELLRDPTLRQYQMEAIRSRGEMLQILLQVLEGLDAAHQRGVVHRDLKPDNIAVGDRPRLIDFGLAKPAVGKGLDRQNVGFGTPTYMAPEQATDAASVGQQADVWSIGVMLYSVASGRVPFVGNSPYEVLVQSTIEPHPPLDDTPVPFERLVDDCLTKRPEERIPHAGQVRDRLGEILAEPGAANWLAEPCVRRAQTPLPTLPRCVAG